MGEAEQIGYTVWLVCIDHLFRRRRTVRRPDYLAPETPAPRDSST